jgi:hypothetical protein
MGEVVALAGKLLLKDLPVLAKILGLKLSVLAAKLVAFVLLVCTLLSEMALRIPELPLDKVLGIAERVLLESLSNDPKIQAAAHETYVALRETLHTDYVVASSGLLLSVAFPVLFVSIALTYKALSRPKLDVFISFNRTREAISEILQKNFEVAGAMVFRIPFQETITHQDVVEQAAKGIKRCDSFVCLPGHAQSYVEGEVMAATTSEKPVVFVVSETSGTLPNTANKRHPVFRLETAVNEQFKSLIEFLDYVGADFKSTRKLCLQALRHPYMQAAKGITLGAGALCLLSLWAYCYYRINVVVPNLTIGAPELAMVERPVRLTHFFLLALVASAACVSFLYCSLFGSTLVRQFRARNRVRLRTIAAQFNRDDWIGVIPGLSPGTSMYECLFAAAPLAHHENERKLDTVGA